MSRIRTLVCGIALAVSLPLLSGGWFTEATAAQLTLTWAETSDSEVGFSIERATGGTGVFAEVAEAGADITAFTDVGLSDGATYCYRIRAFNAVTYSDYSGSACGTTATAVGLAVVKTGGGTGTVTSAPAGITCGGSCSSTYPAGTSIALAANAVAGSTFSGWSGGGCSGTGSCSVTLNATTTVMATFALQSVALTINKAGSGTVTSSPAGINCGGTCSTNFPINTSVTLSASSAPGSAFSGWSGGSCSGTGTCSVSLSAAASVTATFAPQPTSITLTVTKAGGGSGTITSAPSGIDCGTTCSRSYSSGTATTLTAGSGSGSVFAGWSGAGCSGTGACVVTLAAATTVTANFAAQSATLTVAGLGSGNGTVTSTPGGIACGATCVWSYPGGTPVTLLATPGSGSSFAGWSGGGCTGAGVCVTTLAGAARVNATFDLAPSTSFSDTFQRADSTVLAMGWTEPHGDFFIRNRSLWNGTRKTRHLAVQSSLTMATGQVTAEFTSLDNNVAPAFGLVFGFVDAQNYYAAYRQVGGTAVLKIVRVTDGVETVLAQRNCANPVRGSKFELAVSVSSSQVVLTGAGRTLTATGISVAPGKVGLMVAGGGTSHVVDDFMAGP